MVSRPQPAGTEFGGVHSSGVNAVDLTTSLAKVLCQDAGDERLPNPSFPLQRQVNGIRAVADAGSIAIGY